MLPHAPERIVIADDEPQIVNLLDFFLALHGFQPIRTSDGPSALAAIRTNHGQVALLLTDMEMGPMSGIALANRAISEFPTIPVLFMSGSAVQADELQRSFPGCGFLKKPFSPAALLDAVTLLVPSHVHS